MIQPPTDPPIEGPPSLSEEAKSDGEAQPPISPSLSAGWRPTPMWYVAEIVVVVVGVIIAMATNAWWESRQTETVEAEVLASVQRELEINRAELRTIIDLTTDCLARTDRFLRTSSASLLAVPDDSAFHWTGSLACRRTFEPATEAARTLATASGFDSVLDLRIRRAVGRWVTAVSDAAEEAAAMYTHGDEVYRVMASYAAETPEGGLDAFPTIPRLVARGGSTRLAELREDPVLVREVILRAHYQRAYGQELEEAMAAADSALALLDGSSGAAP